MLYTNLREKIISKKLENSKDIKSMVRNALNDECYLKHRNKILELINKYIDKHIDKIDHNVQLWITTVKSAKIFSNYCYKTKIGNELFYLCEDFINKYQVTMDDINVYHSYNIIDEDENFPHIIYIERWYFHERSKMYRPCQRDSDYNSQCKIDDIIGTLNIHIKKKGTKITIFK